MQHYSETENLLKENTKILKDCCLNIQSKSPVKKLFQTESTGDVQDGTSDLLKLLDGGSKKITLAIQLLQIA